MFLYYVNLVLSLNTKSSTIRRTEFTLIKVPITESNLPCSENSPFICLVWLMRKICEEAAHIVLEKYQVTYPVLYIGWLLFLSQIYLYPPPPFRPRTFCETAGWGGHFVPCLALWLLHEMKYAFKFLHNTNTSVPPTTHCL